MTVIDPDSALNGQVNCSVISQPATPAAFQLVRRYSTEYQLKTAAILDRELTERYHVTIRCQDGGGGGNAVDAGKVGNFSVVSVLLILVTALLE